MNTSYAALTAAMDLAQAAFAEGRDAEFPVEGSSVVVHATSLGLYVKGRTASEENPGD